MFEGGSLKKQAKVSAAINGADAAKAPVASLPTSFLPNMVKPYSILVTGIGGTCVVTIGQMLAMAANVQGKGCSVLDMSGLDQRGGPVMSYVRLVDHMEDIYSIRVDFIDASRIATALMDDAIANNMFVLGYA